jgi:hypothetical protein
MTHSFASDDAQRLFIESIASSYNLVKHSSNRDFLIRSPETAGVNNHFT